MSIIQEYKEFVENVETDGTDPNNKKEAWILIAAEYATNARRNGMNVLRSQAQLQRCWDALKLK